MQAVAEQVPLRRLLRRAELEALLGAFAGLLGGQPAAVVELDGTYVAGARAWPAAEVQALLARLRTGQDSAESQGATGTAVPLLAGEVVAGALLVGREAPQAAWRGLQTSLALLLAQAVEKREVARETLDRYREINLLYHVAETIGAGLDPEEIPQQALAAARRVIAADAAAVFLPAAGPEAADAAATGGFVFRAEVGADEGAVSLQHAARQLIAEVYRQGRPDIASLALPAQPGASRPLGTILCAPLKARERVHGVLVLGRGLGEPEFTASDEKLAMALASQAAVAYEKASLHRQALQRQRLEEELSVGRQIQFSFLPETFPQVEGWDFAASYAPARQVGGDFYDLYPLADQPQRLGLVIGDVTGKGVAAALMMASSRTIIRTASMSGRDPRAVLERANRLIAADNRAQLYLSAFYATLDTLTGELRYACGGHDRPLWLRADTGTVEVLDARSLILGAFNEIVLEERNIWLAPGDVVLFFTDGLTEAMNADGEPFGDERLRRVMAAQRGRPAEALVLALQAEVRAFVNDTPQSDDLTLLVVRRCPSPLEE
jgi:sigma-B regulation protein RsbU (phosphoserine phosphatase)